MFCPKWNNNWRKLSSSILLSEKKGNELIIHVSVIIYLVNRFQYQQGAICKKKIFIQKESVAVFPIMYTGDRTKIRILNFFYTHCKFDDGEKYHVLMKLSVSDDVYVKEICFVILHRASWGFQGNNPR